MLLMVGKGIRGGIFHTVHRFEKANNKYMKHYDKKRIILSHVFTINNLYGWAMPQKLAVDCFKWVENMLKFNEDFIKNYDEDSDKGYIFIT